MKCEPLEIAASKTVLGLTPPEALPSAATAALEAGCDSPSLRALAGLTDVEVDEARSLLERALAELSLRLPSERDAVMRLAREIAAQVLEGKTSPYQGAKEIWELSLRLPGESLSDLDSFVYAASEWEDRPEDRNLFAEGIVAAARELVRG